ncbi:MAG: ral secretory system protein domain protein [Planctomycetaceae bacterium]|nr:ral secretory system protein domain protein [Planctomycetaceae bacterium]
MSDEIDVYKDWLGIPEGDRPPDHYQLLRLVQFEDDVEKIRNNYKKLNGHVRKYAAGKHSVRSQELLNELAKAMLCLSDEERKREYDIGLGREVEAVETTGRRPLEIILTQKQLISQSQAEEARSHSQKTGLDMRDVVVQLKLVDQATATQAYAEELGLPFIDLTDLVPDDSILDQVPKKLVKQHSILPLFVDDDVLLIACTHPPDADLEEELRLRLNHPVRAVLATPLNINQGIAKYYAPGARNETVEAVTKGGKTAKGTKSSTSSAPARKEPKKALSQLTPDELRQRQTMGILAFCWTVIPSGLIDTFLVPPGFRLLDMFCVTLITVPIAGYLLWAKCFKR